MTGKTRFEEALARLDAAHSEDPQHEEAGGSRLPRELLYARRMSAWLERLAPDASEALRLAVRSQHLCRWRIPRDSYPRDRQGYLRWRRDCARMHADLAGRILLEVGYEAGSVARVRRLIEKRDLDADEEAQLLEDAACLVFLENELERFAATQETPKLRRILRRTWKKMSPVGRRAAVALDLSPAVARLLADIDAPC